MNIRTDLADSGIYICKYWILKLIEDLEKDHEIEISSMHVRKRVLSKGNSIIGRIDTVPRKKSVQEESDQIHHEAKE